MVWQDDGGILSSTIGPLPPCSSFREGRAAMAEVTGMRDQRQGSAMALSPGDEAAASFFPIPGIVRHQRSHAMTSDRPSGSSSGAAWRSEHPRHPPPFGEQNRVLPPWFRRRSRE
nr:hypothetical protein Itr_chr01CG10020 [Ipomoea trifida]